MSFLNVTDENILSVPVGGPGRNLAVGRPGSPLEPCCGVSLTVTCCVRGKAVNVATDRCDLRDISGLEATLDTRWRTLTQTSLP
ncbi:hypothetical protein AOLI_G00177960 [Acnodon oligacanthus]